MTDLDKTLQELEGKDWGEPTYDSYVIRTCHRLRRVPLKGFSVEDLRIMLSQQIGIPYLVPIALQRLDVTPLAEGDYFPGDLLEQMLTITNDYWDEHRDSHLLLLNILEHAISDINRIEDADEATMRLKNRFRLYIETAT